MNSNKAQMSLFLIIGIVVLFVFMMLFYIVSGLYEANQPAPSSEDIKLITQGCMKQAAEKGLKTLGNQGAYIELQRPYARTPFSNITYLRYLPSMENIAFDLENYINARLVTCIENYTRSSRVKIKDPNTEVRFTANNVLVLVDDFITIKTNNTEENIGILRSDAIRLRFPTIYETITNLEENRINMDALSVDNLNTTVLTFGNDTIYVIEDKESFIGSGTYRFMIAT